MTRYAILHFLPWPQGTEIEFVEELQQHLKPVDKDEYSRLSSREKKAFVVLEPGNVLLEIHESGGGESYHEHCEIRFCESIDDALEFAGDWYDTEHDDHCPRCLVSPEDCKREMQETLQKEGGVNFDYCVN